MCISLRKHIKSPTNYYQNNKHCHDQGSLAKNSITLSNPLTSADIRFGDVHLRWHIARPYVAFSFNERVNSLSARGTEFYARYNLRLAVRTVHKSFKS